ncbi:MAG: inositol monophosphatase [Pseudomonadota bacterium]
MLPASELVEIVRAASRVEIMPRFRALNAADIKVKSRADDLVTEAELVTERRITAAVAELMPAAAIVGEEAVAADPSILSRIADAETCVILDPIDGTWNYAHGSSTFGVILAVTHRGETVFGLLYDPVNDDWIEAERGGGAWFCRAGRREPLTLTPAPPLAEAHAFIAPYLLPPETRPALWSAMQAVGRASSLRCSCHEYRMLATGAAQIGFAAMLNPWDHAAGVLIHREAGGVARLLDGRDYAPILHAGRLLLAADEAGWQAAAQHFPADL